MRRAVLILVLAALALPAVARAARRNPAADLVDVPIEPYSVCNDKRGRPIRGIDKTVAHRDHVHIGMTRAGAAARTSFWRGHTG